MMSHAPSKRFRSPLSLSGVYLVPLVLLTILVGCSQSGVGVTDEIGIRIANEELPESRVVQLSTQDGSERSRSYSITIDNNGAEELLVERLQYTNPEHFTLYSEDIPGPIPAGGSAAIEVSFHPRKTGDFSSEVRLYTDSDDSPITFDVRGTSR